MSEFNLQTALRAISERRTEAERQEQDALNIAGRGRLDPNSPSERIARAKQFEKEILEQVARLRKQPLDDTVQMRLDAAFDRLGELAAEQGDYARAVRISKSPERREHYQSIVKAIKLSDEKECECEPDLIVDRANMQEFRSPAIHTVDQIVSPDGRILNLDVCRKCGFKNCR